MEKKELKLIPDGLKGQVIEELARVNFFVSMRQQYQDILMKFEPCSWGEPFIEAVRCKLEYQFNIIATLKDRWDIEFKVFHIYDMLEITMSLDYGKPSIYQQRLEDVVVDKILNKLSCIDLDYQQELTDIKINAESVYLSVDNLTAWNKRKVGIYYIEQECGERWFILPINWNIDYCSERVVIDDHKLQENEEESKHLNDEWHAKQRKPRKLSIKEIDALEKLKRQLYGK